MFYGWKGPLITTGLEGYDGSPMPALFEAFTRNSISDPSIKSGTVQ